MVGGQNSINQRREKSIERRNTGDGFWDAGLFLFGFSFCFYFLIIGERKNREGWRGATLDLSPFFACLVLLVAALSAGCAMAMRAWARQSMNGLVPGGLHLMGERQPQQPTIFFSPAKPVEFAQLFFGRERKRMGRRATMSGHFSLSLSLSHTHTGNAPVESQERNETKRNTVSRAPRHVALFGLRQMGYF